MPYYQGDIIEGKIVIVFPIEHNGKTFKELWLETMQSRQNKRLNLAPFEGHI